MESFKRLGMLKELKKEVDKSYAKDIIIKSIETTFIPTVGNIKGIKKLVTAKVITDKAFDMAKDDIIKEYLGELDENK